MQLSLHFFNLFLESFVGVLQTLKAFPPVQTEQHKKVLKISWAFVFVQHSPLCKCLLVVLILLKTRSDSKAILSFKNGDECFFVES